MCSGTHTSNALVDTPSSRVCERALLLSQRFPYLLDELRGAQLFITGGTGFIGRWLLECLALAEDRYALGLHATVLTRDRAAFARTYPGAAALLTHPALHFVAGDVRQFEYPDTQFTHVVHGAHTSAQATFNREDPLTQFDTACAGTRRVLELALRSGARRFLMLSSGSVYGASPADMARIREDFADAPFPQDVGAALNHGKRAAEFLCEYYRQKHGLETVVARCFTFVGPGLPLDIHYAIGNFIRDALWGEALEVKGDGMPVRSYLDIADLLVWLLVMLMRAPSGSLYNVGSDVPISIFDLATLVRDVLAPGKPVRVLGQHLGSTNRNIYVPDISRARAVLQLDVWTPLEEAIRMTARHAQSKERERG